MLDLAAKLVEDRLGARRVGGLGAHQPEQLALPRRRGRAADRTLDERGALAAHLRRQCGFHARRHGAHLDEQLACHVARQQARRSVIHRVDRRAVGQDGDDRFAGGGNRRRAGDDPGAGFCERLAVFAAVRFQTVTWCPTSMSRAAMAPPMAPSPATPICIRRSPDASVPARTLGDQCAARKPLARGRADAISPRHAKRQ